MQNVESEDTTHRSFGGRMKNALDITGENFEDLLAYDDLFLDYFNAFLALNVFPIATTYNRLTGSFEEVNYSDDDHGGSSASSQRSLQYAPTDEERDQLLVWAREERLPLFLSTQLFREFKLCKLLLRALDDRYSAGRHSTMIRGYSRQSESYVSSFSNSADNSAHDEIDDDEDIFMDSSNLRHSGLYRYQRPGSKALSVPTRMCLGSETTQRGSTITATQDSSRGQSQSAKNKKKKELNFTEGTVPGLELNADQTPVSRENTVVKFDEKQSGDEKRRKSSRRSRRNVPVSDVEETFLRHVRALSAPVNYEEYMRHPKYVDFDFLFGEAEPDTQGQVYVTFEDEHVSDEQTENDVKNLEGRLKMSLQQLKEQALGSYGGMEAYKEFLKGTAGDQLINFWLDCEYYKDTVENFDELSQNDIRNRLFRDIRDRYKMNLTEDARNQISKSASCASLSHTIFLRTQYDVLRRLRAYWVPRFLIHQERLREFSDIGAGMGITMLAKLGNGTRHALPFFPSISLVNSMPVRPDDVLTYSKTKNWEFISQGGRRLDNRVTSAKVRQMPPARILYSRSTRIAKNRFIMALMGDKVAGGPFQRFLERQSDRLLLSNLLFWQDVTEYGQAEDRSADRLLRLCHSWTIYNKYLLPNSHYSIGLSETERDELHATLLKAKDFVEASVFNMAKFHAMERLERAWMRYLQEDLKAFLDAHVRPGAESPPSTADVIHISVAGDELLITRPMPWVKRVPTTDSQRAAQLRQALGLGADMNSEQRAEMRAKARERRKEMERERKKAIRAAYRRVKEAKQKKDTEKKEDGDDMDYDIEGDEKRSAKPPPPFTEMTHNKQFMTNFKKHLQESEDKERLNMVSLYLDTDTYLNLGSSKTDQKKKETHAGFIFKTYVDSHGKKHLSFPDKLTNKIGERPKTGAIKEMQSIVVPKLEEAFNAFLVEKASENGMDPRDFANLSQAELALRMGTETSMNWKKGRKGKTPDPLELSNSNLSKGLNGKVIREIEFPAITVSLYEHEQDEDNRATRKVHFAGDNEDENFQVQLHKSATPSIRRTLYSRPQNTRKRNIKDESARTASQTDQGPGGRRGRRNKLNVKTGRAQPTKDDREEFFKALKSSAAGHLTLTMLYFYKYLQKHGEEENAPLLDKDLFFYIEVQKFKDCSHAYADEESLRKKVQSIMECFLDAITSPALQIDVTQATQDKAIRAAQRYLQGKDVMASIFDEPQLMVFKELLPYWAGFRRTFQPPDDPTKRPVTKHEKMLKKRLEAIENYEIPSNEFHLPSIPEGSIAAYTFSLSDGVRWREVSTEEAQSILGSPIDRSETATTLRGGKSGVESLRKRVKSQSHLSVPGMSSGRTSPGHSVSVKD
ncbi:regulator of G-protein signaling 22-like isoform X3 [Argopecten irradians]|uniref:regulator of G-protein signaling 22-like isoform X3 n=1 Tax=Argopecten irradians TaxID=31199 RepID=UPI00371E061C